MNSLPLAPQPADLHSPGNTLYSRGWSLRKSTLSFLSGSAGPHKCPSMSQAGLVRGVSPYSAKTCNNTCFNPSFSRVWGRTGRDHRTGFLQTDF